MPDHKLLALKTIIRTRDFDASKDFYTRILGLEILEEYEEQTGRGCIFGLKADPNNAFIEISETSKEDENLRASFPNDFESDKVGLQIRADSVDDWSGRLEELRWKTRGPVNRPWGLRYLYFRDPDNLQIIIFGK